MDELSPAALTPLQSTWTIAPFRGAGIEHKPRWRKFEMIYESSLVTDSVSIGYYPDMDVTALTPIVYPVVSTATVANGLNTGKFELPVYGRSEIISFEIIHNGNSDFRMKNVEVYMNDGGLR